MLDKITTTFLICIYFKRKTSKSCNNTRYAKMQKEEHTSNTLL